jgi:hypothetical protein
MLKHACAGYGWILMADFLLGVLTGLGSACLKRGSRQLSGLLNSEAAVRPRAR